MRFYNVNSGGIEVPQNQKVIEQYKKYPEIYKPIESGAPEPTLKELKEKANQLGIEYAKNIKKAELLKLINNAETTE